MIEFLTGWTIQILLLLAGVIVMIAVMYAMVRLLAKPQIRTIPPELVGSEGVALTDVSRTLGKVDVDGNRFIAIADAAIPAGRRVRVVKVEGVVAKVEPVG